MPLPCLPCCVALLRLLLPTVSSECILLCCIASLMICIVAGFSCDAVSLPLCLISCLVLSWDGVFVGIGAEVVCVCGVCQNDSIVGWSEDS